MNDDKFDRKPRAERLLLQSIRQTHVHFSVVEFMQQTKMSCVETHNLGGVAYCNYILEALEFVHDERVSMPTEIVNNVYTFSD